MGGYYAQTKTTGVTGDESSLRRTPDHAPDLYGARSSEFVKVGNAYNLKSVVASQGTSTGRSVNCVTAASEAVQHPAGRDDSQRVEYIQGSSSNAHGVAPAEPCINVERENSVTSFSIEGGTNYEQLAVGLQRGARRQHPDRRLQLQRLQWHAMPSVSSGGRRARCSIRAGSSYNGHIQAFTVSGARVSVTTPLSVEPSVSINQVTLPVGGFTTTVLRARSDYAFSPRMFASGLVQYSSNDRVFSSNFRFRWEYQPGQNSSWCTPTNAIYVADGLPVPQEPCVRGQGEQVAEDFRLKISRLKIGLA